MKTPLFLFSLFFVANLFAQTLARQEMSETLMKKFKATSEENAQSTNISFIQNKGQIHDQYYNPRPDVLFGATAGNMTFHLKTNGVSYQLTLVDSYKEVEDSKTNQTRKVIDQQTIYRIDLSWINANANFVTSTDKSLDGYDNFYTAGCSEGGVLNVKSYTGVSIHNLYTGINLHYYEKEGQLKHDYIVAPGANYKQIQLSVDGAKVSINKDGSLLLNTPLGKIQEGAPIVFQNGKQLKARWIIDKQTLSFNIENYNPNQELIIDPVTRVWGTFYGYSNDEGKSCSTDASGNVFMAGIAETNIGTVIATTGSHQSSLGGGTDAFLVKFNSSGVRQWGTYYGSTGNEAGNSCAADVNGNIYMAGSSFSSASNILATIGSHQSVYGGGTSDAFLVKFNSAGVRQWGTYYGDVGPDLGNACSLDPSGNVYLAGKAGFGTNITTAGAHQINGTGNGDPFLVKFNSSGVRQWGTYHGGGAIDEATSCATDASGNVYLVGTTSSSSFIASVGSHQATYGGVRDGFLAKFNSAGVRQWSTYYGSPSLDNAYSCATDADGNIYIAGDAEFSPGTTIATSGAHQSVNGGDDDAFLVQFNSSGVRQWGTYYGGTGTDRGYSCATDATGNVYLVGMTNSNTGIATIGAHQQIYAGSVEAFLVKFNTFGTRLSGTYYGSADIDIANECTVDPMGNIYLAGQTWSYTNSGIATAGAHQTINNGGAIAFLAKFDKCTDPTTAIVNQSACDSYTWSLNGTTYTSSGTYTHVETNANGCQLTTTLNLIINNSSTATINQTACDSYTWAMNGTTYTSSGNYTYIGTNANGCPLTTTLNLTINNSTTATVNQTTCDSYTWALNGTTYTSSGTYAHVGTNAAGCPLTTTLNLTINNSTTASVTQTACDSYTWALNGTTYTSSGTYTHVGTNAVGCPLTTTLNLTINNSTTSTVNQTACDSYTWALNGTTYTSSGTYTHVGTNAAGCLLTTTLNLTINNSTIATVTQTACDSYTWALNGSSYTSSGTYTHVGTNSAGCPFTTTLNLTINNSTAASVTQTACDSYTWALNGTTYTSSGSYTHVGTNAAGCPFTTTLNLTINNSTTATVNQTACDAYTWALNGTTYTSSGTYTHVSTNPAGCSLTTTLNLVINNSTTATVNQTECDSYTWALHGTTYTSSGTYTHVSTNAGGCPLTTTLNLIINNSTTASVNETACDSYTWALNGTTYNNSGVYTHVASNAAGCDFTTTLNLTINNSTIDTMIESACETYNWVLNGNTYTTSGTYIYTGTNANGCPLSSTLILTINDSISVSVAETACDNFTWNLNGTNYNSSGIYTNVSTSTTGCLITTTLNLTINNSTTATVNETACDTYTWGLNGIPYSTSGTYTYDSINAAGCPLTTTLNLTINNSTNNTVNETACNTYTWGLNGSNYSTSGTYTYLDINAAGCPQTNTLNLVISTIDTSTTFNGATITANAVGATYQWIDCDNGNTPIAGATSQSFMPVSNGNYAVIVSDANCMDTSACYNVNTVGFSKLNAGNISVYPNPTAANVQINLGKAYQNTSIKLVNLLGETINHKTYTSTNEITFEIEGASGVYFLEIESTEQVLDRIRVIKN